MKITLLKQQVNDADRVSVFVDNAYSFSLTLDQILEQKLKKGVEVDETRIEELKSLSNEGKVRAKVLEWLMIRPHSTSEFREYCYRKKIDKDLADKLAADLTRHGYLDDEKFVRWFVEQRLRKGKSARSVYAELAAKGIDRALAQPIVENDSNDSAALQKLIAKLRTRSRYSDDRKLIAYLIGKGFSYSDIREVLQDGNND